MTEQNDRYLALLARAGETEQACWDADADTRTVTVGGEIQHPHFRDWAALATAHATAADAHAQLAAFFLAHPDQDTGEDGREAPEWATEAEANAEEALLAAQATTEAALLAGDVGDSNAEQEAWQAAGKAHRASLEADLCAAALLGGPKAAPR